MELDADLARIFSFLLSSVGRFSAEFVSRSPSFFLYFYFADFLFKLMARRFQVDFDMELDASKYFV